MESSRAGGDATAPAASRRPGKSILRAVVNDIRAAVRGLWRARVFTFAAAVTLAIGMTGTVVIFAIVYGVLLRPLPVHDEGRLIVAWKELRASGFAHYPFGGPEVEAVREAGRLFEDVAGVTSNGAWSATVVENGIASYVQTALVTGGYFEVLGIQPFAGRALTRADDRPGAEAVVVISHGLWKRRYGGSPDTIGRRITLGDIAFTIVGVVPPGLDYPIGVEVWRPVGSVPAEGVFGEAAHYEVDLIARLRPGVTIEQAGAELASLVRRLETTAPPNHPRGLVPIVRSFRDVIVGDVRLPMLALFGSVALVLLIAAANVANLLLLRGEGRSRELAVRAALGAGRGRISSLLMAESAVLAGGAGAAAFGLSWWSLDAVLAAIPVAVPRGDAIHADARLLAFTVSCSCLVAFAVGIVPALGAMRRDLLAQLRGQERTASARHGRRVLVAAQVALAVIVAAGAGLLIQSVLKLQRIPLGLSPHGLVLIDLVPSAKFRDPVYHARFLDEFVARLEATPAITAATPVNVAPYSGLGGWDVPRFTAFGQTPADAAANSALNLESVHPNYFETLDVHILRGRSFTEADRERAPNVAIVSESVAARTWPGEDPVGKRLKMGGPDSEDPWRTVVGVAAPSRYRELEDARPTLYVPAKQFLNFARIVVVRSPAPLDLIASLAREHAGALDTDVRVIGVTPFERLLEAPMARPLFNARVVGVFAAAALLLAAVGLYAVVAGYVRQRDREIGIRVALGATTGKIRTLVLTEAMWPAGLGAAAGLAAALVATQVLRGMLFGIDPVDPPTLAGAALLVLTGSLLAISVPIRRATRIDPALLLRTE